MNRSYFVFLALGLLALSACDDPYEPTLHPDYTIRVVPTKQGSIAVPPECPSWATETSDPFDNQPMPQYGCSTAQDLAAMVEKPRDLIEGRPLAAARGVTEVGAVRRYDNNQTRGLILPASDSNQAAVTTSSAPTSSITGDVTGGGGSASSAPAAASAAP